MSFTGIGQTSDNEQTMTDAENELLETEAIEENELLETETIEEYELLETESVSPLFITPEGRSQGKPCQNNNSNNDDKNNNNNAGRHQRLQQERMSLCMTWRKRTSALY